MNTNNSRLSILKFYVQKISNIFPRPKVSELILVASVQVVVFAFGFFFFGLLPVSKEVESIKGEMIKPIEADRKESINQIDLLTKLRNLKHKESFLKSAIEFAKVDSVSLLIDLNDSIAYLTYRGVNLFGAKILNIKLNSGLEQMPTYIRDSLYAGPMQILEEISSIEKYPVTVKKAPKDTMEVKNTDTIPAPPKQLDVYYFFAFSSNFVVEIRQSDGERPHSKKTTKKYEQSKSEWFENKSIEAIKNPQNRSYIYQLFIELSTSDAQSIYRALPRKPFVAIRYR